MAGEEETILVKDMLYAKLAALDTAASAVFSVGFISVERYFYERKRTLDCRVVAVVCSPVKDVIRHRFDESACLFVVHYADNFRITFSEFEVSFFQCFLLLMFFMFILRCPNSPNYLPAVLQTTLSSAHRRTTLLSVFSFRQVSYYALLWES